MQKWLMSFNICFTLLILATLAMIASDFISHKMSGMFLKGPKQVSAPSGQTPVLRTDDLSGFSPILEKGLFGRATQGKLTPIIPSGPQAAPATAQGDLLLLGTVLGSTRETFALIQKLSSKEEKVFRLSDRVFDIGPLVSVTKESAEIMSGDRKIRIQTPISGAVDNQKQPGQPGQTGPVTTTGSGSYVIDQRALNAALDNIGQAMTDARLLPSMKEGKVEGFRVAELRPGGVFDMVGIKNGDVLLRINDFPIDSPEKAMQSFVSLKGQSRIKLDIFRETRPVSLNYDIR